MLNEAKIDLESTFVNNEAGADNIQIMGLDIHTPVFPLSATIIIIFVTFTLLYPEAAAETFGSLRLWVTSTFDWVFTIASSFFILFCMYLACSKLGRIRLGGPDAKPQYKYPAWLAMLFSAGIGIGLMFFGVMEPLNHTLTPPLGIDSANIDASASAGMAASIFHWGLHAWGLYAVVGLSLAFFCFNRGLPLSLRSAFHPILGERVHGWWGHAIDLLAVFATMFGLATALGYGAEQIAAGLSYLYGIEATVTSKLLIIAIITVVALISVLAGMEKGVKRLSTINMVMAALLFIFVLVAGPTLVLTEGYFIALGDYFYYLPQLSNWIGREDTSFYHGWTIFYLAFWVSWSPFVGMFIARISRGRTIREFVVCVLIVPTLVCALWIAVLGGNAVDQMLSLNYTGVQETIINWTPEFALFKMLALLPFPEIVSTASIVLITIFFVTSSDSGSLVIDTITAGGKINAPKLQRAFWCTLEGLVAGALMLGGGLGALQALTISTGLPFVIILLVMCFSLLKGLHEENSLLITSGKKTTQPFQPSSK